MCVFEAIEIDYLNCKKGSIAVLKDIWVDKDCDREGTILAQLYNDAKGEDKELVQKYFLTTICHRDVRLGPEVVDDTEYGIMRGLKTRDTTFSLQYVRTGSMSRSDRSMESLCGMEILDYHNPATYGHKANYCIIFKEHATTIGNVCQFHCREVSLAEVSNCAELLMQLIVGGKEESVLLI
jgi:hypothetical protein